MSFKYVQKNSGLGSCLNNRQSVHEKAPKAERYAEIKIKKQ